MILVKKIIALLAAIMLLLSACSSATLDGAGEELEDTIANATDADNKYVQMVKGGYRPDDPDVTYEDAFTAFFGTPRWKYFESEDGQDVVEFTGDCTYQDVPVKARIQFVVDEENGTFEASYLAFNEVPQDALTLAAVISKAFEEYEAAGTGGGQGQEQSSNTTGQILIRQIPTQDVLKMTADEVVTAFGEPEIYAENDSIEYGADAPEWMYFDVSNGNTVASFSANAEEFTLNGQSLKQNFDALVSLMGDNYDSLGAGGYQWIREGICYTFYIPDDTEPYSINVYRIDNDDPIDNDAYLDDNYSTLDNDLCGRWRSYDGSALTLESSGYATTVFQFWNVLNDKPDSVTWEASNGRLTLYAHHTLGYYWIIGEGTRFDTETEELYLKEITSSNTPYSTVPTYAGYYQDGDYYRVKTGNKDLVGTWTNNTREWIFNSDGTGQLGTNPMTWWATETELYYSPVESRAYDYTVSGDTLTIFFNDGAKVYTRVCD